MKTFISIFCTLLIAATGFAQQDNTADFYKTIQKHDVSAVLNASPIDYNPVGIIGTDFQRFQIHFSSIKKNPQNPYEYLVSGKTMVKNNRCDFTGTITIKTAIIYPDSERPPIKEGQLTAVVRLEEDKKQYGTGIISGTLTADFMVEKGVVGKNTLYAGADIEPGRMFEGEWTSYATNKSKVCNWGDDRVPPIQNSDGSIASVNVGDGEFQVDPEYRKNGWENYCIAWQTPNFEEDKKVEKAVAAAQAKEKNWWK